jgi:glycosyltransferase involved in cell wall biosynthesis
MSGLTHLTTGGAPAADGYERTLAGRGLRISMIGSRGVPATYGGVERHVEELGARLAQRGHEVTVWCRSGYGDDERGEPRPKEYRGMRLRYLPALSSRSLEAISHSALSTVASLARHQDVVHYHAVGPGLVAPIARWGGRSNVVLTVHGLDAERAKWGRAATAVLRTATWMSARVPHRTITVSSALAQHYQDRYGRRADWIPNGVEPATPQPPGDRLRRWGLEPGRYVLFVGRLVPEKAPDQLVRAFLSRSVSAETKDVRLVLAGGSSFTDAYAGEVAAAAGSDPRVVATGYVYGDDLRELYSNAGLFVNASSLEGLPLTLLEACAAGTPVLVSDIEPHLEVLGGQGPGRRSFPVGDIEALSDALERCLTHLEDERVGAAPLRDDVLRRYSWDAAADATERLYRSLVAR